MGASVWVTNPCKRAMKVKARSAGIEEGGTHGGLLPGRARTFDRT